MEAYDIVVLGGGSGSQVATAAAERGLEAAVVEPGPLGGACITRGCVPSKALIHRADVVEAVRGAEAFGIDAGVHGVDYDGITDAIHDTVYAKADNQTSSMREAANVTLCRGEGRFVDDRTIAVDPDDGSGTAEITGETVVIAVGGRPMVPPIDGLEGVGYLTSDDALFLDERPDELVIVGGGYIGAELGYFFGALGADISLVGRSERLVPREDEAVSTAVTESLADYCDVYTGYEAAEVEPADERQSGEGIVVTAEPSDDGNDGGETVELAADDLLLATGRRPNTDTLALEETGVETDDKGYVETDNRLETAVDGIWVLGDVIGQQPYKHAADYEAQVVMRNVLDDASRTVDYEAMPHAIFTEPRVASVGQTEGDLADAGREYEVATVPYDAAPLGLILEAGDGFVKALAGPDGEILGCHIVGPQAATLLHEVVVAMDGGGTVDDVAGPVHVHPALNEVVYAAFDELSSRAYSTAPDWRDVGDG
ncbi:dihydrolipoamide dehydrogenase [Natrinema pellirubrum DSM 15624]|uniref:Dihydrolipoamide dehydrogenase n=1 Tax=Natrinema pellirubrum (strain DSM 15624 / CIP 106293 / JCM 10476 / NCIMB 786 / 157) TaxID=797303 RepID=L0JSX1_NATP1|nr:dihydrolipoyl dehydrogenase [Natrinema pellirubrum]AGB33481.1 pyruvate/2-oxoglutarate dehydrogenase complex, dihydrolipoamide dehydrogenase component [Natrinema pellirubrum DSM 15624]ELY71170.1 dihydrolipoamide dehydrogenase [Natrinema pellirubrum DSM 15624]